MTSSKSVDDVLQAAQTNPQIITRQPTNGSLSRFSTGGYLVQGQGEDLFLGVTQVIESAIVFLYGGFSLMGIVPNVLNILVLGRQGLVDRVNIPLLGLAISDLCSDVAMLWTTICTILMSAKVPPLLFDLFGLYVLTGVVPRIIFNRVRCWLTALLSLQRCLCVTLPFRVKAVFTPRRTLSLTTGTIVLVFSVHMTIYISRYFSRSFDPHLNVTRYVITVAEEAFEMMSFRLIFLFMFLPLVNFFTIVVCSALLVLSLTQSTAWRKSNATSRKTTASSSTIREDALTNSDTMTENRSQNKNVAKETRLTRMITAMTVVAVVCNTPSNVLLVASSLVPGFTEIGEYSALFRTIYSFRSSTGDDQLLHYFLGLFFYEYQIQSGL